MAGQDDDIAGTSSGRLDGQGLTGQPYDMPDVTAVLRHPEPVVGDNPAVISIGERDLLGAPEEGKSSGGHGPPAATAVAVLSTTSPQRAFIGWARSRS